MAFVAKTLLSHDQIVRLRISWTAYNALVQELGDDSHARLAYDGETLEIMSPGSKHELIANIIAALIDLASVEWSVNLTNFGSTTFKAEPHGGFEADKSYYRDAHQRIQNVEHIDLAVDPPPDLVVEVDITSDSSTRLFAYAALGVPELWHFKNDNFALLALTAGQYIPQQTSRIISGLPALEVARRIEATEAAKGDTLGIRREWQRWLRENQHLHTTT